MDIVLTSDVMRLMLAAARAAHPQEACGLLLGEGSRITAVRAARNVHQSPATHFEIDPQALIDAHRAARAPGGLAVVGCYHSHPRGPATPSATDRALAARDGRIWAIIAGDEVRFWRDREEGFAPLPFTLIES